MLCRLKMEISYFNINYLFVPSKSNVEGFYGSEGFSKHYVLPSQFSTKLQVKLVQCLTRRDEI